MIDMRNGFTLVELIVVMALIGIMLAVSSLEFSSMQRNYGIEKVTRELLSDISEYRMKAMTRKEPHSITLNANEYIFRRVTSQVLKRATPYPLANQSATPFSGTTVITFDEQGFTGSGTLFGQTIVVGPANSSSSVNCVVISNARVNMGKMNGTTCEFK